MKSLRLTINVSAVRLTVSKFLVSKAVARQLRSVSIGEKDRIIFTSFSRNVWEEFFLDILTSIANTSHKQEGNPPSSPKRAANINIKHSQTPTMCQQTQLQFNSSRRNGENSNVVHSAAMMEGYHSVSFRRSNSIQKDQSSSSGFLKYAKKFALLTLLTAYLGKHAHDRSQIIAPGSGGYIASLSLYEYIVPGMYSPNYLLYFALLFYMINKIWKYIGYQVSSLQRVTSEAIQTVTSAQALSRIRSTVSTTSIRILRGTNTSRDAVASHSIIIAASDPFLSTEVMEKMTLGDVACVFQYAMNMNKSNFEEEAFLKVFSPAAHEAARALDHAIAISRGAHTSLSEADRLSSSDTMDALAYAAAIRIFADWRGVRAIPSGYQKFAFGMGLARRDLIQNVSKIEVAVHNWLDAQQSALGSSQKQELNFASPTMRQLLQHEFKVRLHSKLPYLKEHSAASGILWSKRQLQYQSYALDFNAKVPLLFPSSKAAFNAAYEKVYGKYHGFLVRSVFKSTFESAPSAEEVLDQMNMPYALQEQKVVEVKPLNIFGDEDEDECWVQLPIEDETEYYDDTQLQEIVCTENEQDCEQGVDVHIGDKILQLFSLAFGKCVVGSPSLHESKNAMAGTHVSHDDLRRSTQVQEIKKNDVPFYLSVLRPLEDGLDSLLVDMNMNDPSKV